MTEETKLKQIKELLENANENSYFPEMKGKILAIIDETDFTQDWIDAIQKAINSTRVNLELAAGYDFDQDEEDSERYKAYWAAAACIVEGEFDMDENVANTAYGEFMENDNEKWAAFISNSFGSEWGKIAELVNEVGY